MYTIITKAFYNGKEHNEKTDMMFHNSDTKAICDLDRKIRLKRKTVSDFRLEYAIIKDSRGNIIYEERIIDIINNSHQKLKEKLKREITEFRNYYSGVQSTKVYRDWYMIGFKEAYYEMLMSDFANDDSYNEVFEWLNQFEMPIDFLYNEWLSCDSVFNHDWDEMLRWLENLHEEEN